ncbi:MAG: hypothetical protein ABSB00_03665 [Minisyncoccia bacterium]|jgi:hypothetical protein
MKLKPIVLIVLPLAALLAPALAFAGAFFAVSIGGVSCGYFCWLGQMVLLIINSVLVPVLFAISFIVFLYGIASAYIFSSGDPEEVKKGHKLILWGIIAFVVMVSLWGIVNVIANTFGLTGYFAPPLPTSPVY